LLSRAESSRSPYGTTSTLSSSGASARSGRPLTSRSCTTGRGIVEPADAAATEAALKAGAEVVYQAVLAHGSWFGKTDFVERQLDGSSEVNAKLARGTRSSMQASPSSVATSHLESG
jgi:hypothetical protein